MVKLAREILVCQDDKTLFENVERCEACKGGSCEYLQSYPRGEIRKLKEQGYRWFEKQF